MRKGYKVTIQEICDQFYIMGTYVECKELTTGNINGTYLVSFVRDGQPKKYILQRINTNVFCEPEKVMDNIVRVTEYIRNNVREEGLSTHKFVMRAFLSKKDMRPYVRDDMGGYWRCYRYIANSETYDATDDLTIIERVGGAFGRFQNFLDGFDASSLHESIPNFHNTVKRYERFEEIVKKDEFNRVKYCQKEIEDVLSFKKEACLLQNYLDQGKIPLRVTHNDTKSNNVSFDKDTKEALAVLDLDTVMPGAIAYDYGDAIRFIANTVIEDNPNVDEVKLDVDKYTAFTKGFIGEVNQKLEDLERDTLNLGVFAMTVELAVRFLGDYLDGDRYFKIKHPGHNMDRARNQIALAKDIIKKREQIDAIFSEVCKGMA